MLAPMKKICILIAVLAGVFAVLLLAACAGPTSTTSPAISSTSAPATSSSTVVSVAAAATTTTEPGSESTSAPSASSTAVWSVSAAAGTLQVHYLDVGQGDSILILAPDGKVMLIDGGESNSGALAYLKAKGITHIDLMVATHPHSDHIGGLVRHP